MPTPLRSPSPDDEDTLPCASSPTPPLRSLVGFRSGLFDDLQPSSPEWSDEETVDLRPKLMATMALPPTRNAIYLTELVPSRQSTNPVGKPGRLGFHEDLKSRLNRAAKPPRLSKGQERVDLLRKVAKDRQARVDARRRNRARSARYYSQHKGEIAARRKIKRDAETERLGCLPDTHRDEILASRRAKQREYSRRYREKLKGRDRK
ncbi:hypothetical protein PM082_023247 [Marasmius tenuissimus]|nr:hypothetical protein PM082_023247 [Marasmius tenuissimus]